MKKIFIVCLCAFICSHSKSQYQEIDEKKEFLGIQFLSNPDYSNLSYFRSGRDFNLYKFKNGMLFKTPDYSLSQIDIAVKKGRIMDFTCTIENENDIEKIKNDLNNLFTVKVERNDGTTYHGKNIIFLVTKNKPGEKNYLFITTKKTDTIPEIRDNSGIMDLLGKPISDPAVMKFISSIPGKNEKKEFEFATDITWPGEGIVLSFKGKGDEATLSTILVYFMKDNYYWKDKPFKGTIKLPYGITSNTSVLQLRDMFSEEDSEFGSSSWRTKNYKKFKVYCNFGDPVKQNKNDLLNHISFK